MSPIRTLEVSAEPADEGARHAVYRRPGHAHPRAATRGCRHRLAGAGRRAPAWRRRAGGCGPSCWRRSRRPVGASRPRRLRWHPEGQRPGTPADRHARGRGRASPAGAIAAAPAGRRPCRSTRPSVSSPGRQHTLGVRERALWLVTELSYARTARTLEELRGLAVSHGQLHRWVAEEGARIEADVAARTEAIFGAHPERGPTLGRHDGDVWVSADGTMVHDRGERHPRGGQAGLVFRGHRTDRQGPPAPARPPLRAAPPGRGRRSPSASPRPARRWASTRPERILFVSDGAPPSAGSGSGPSPTRSSCSTGITSSSSSAPGSGSRPGGARAGHRGGPARRRRGPPRDPHGPCPLAPARRPRAGARCRASSATSRTTAGDRQLPHRAAGVLGTHGEGRRHHHGPPLQAPGHELVPAWRQPPASHLRLLRLNGTWDRYWAERMAAALRPWPSAA